MTGSGAWNFSLAVTGLVFGMGLPAQQLGHSHLPCDKERLLMSPKPVSVTPPPHFRHIPCKHTHGHCRRTFGMLSRGGDKHLRWNPSKQLSHSSAVSSAAAPQVWHISSSSSSQLNSAGFITT